MGPSVELSWPRYLAIFAAISLVTAGFVAAVNASVDVSALYRKSRTAAYAEDYVAQLLRSEGGLVIGANDRGIKNRLAETADADCFLTGSSHEMQIGLDNFPAARGFGCTRLINLAVSGGSFEDFLVGAAILKDRGRPLTLLVGVAPWMLKDFPVRRADPNTLARARASLGLPARGDAAQEWALVQNLINLRYFWRNVESWREGQTPAKKPAAQASASEAVYRPDGSLVYSENYKRQAETTPIGDGSYRIAKPYIDDATQAEFARVAGMLRGASIRLALVLSPYHPSVFRCSAQEACEALALMEARVREQARALDLPVVGSYRPEPYGLTPSDFYDDMHPKADAYRRLN